MPQVVSKGAVVHSPDSPSFWLCFRFHTSSCQRAICGHLSGRWGVTLCAPGALTRREPAAQAGGCAGWGVPRCFLRAPMGGVTGKSHTDAELHARPWSGPPCPGARGPPLPASCSPHARGPVLPNAAPVPPALLGLTEATWNVKGRQETLRTSKPQSTRLQTVPALRLHNSCDASRFRVAPCHSLTCGSWG